MPVPPLIITGMHRSGTSLTARLLQHGGLDVGTRLMAPRLDNPVGYYEDLAFADLNRQLVAAGVGDDPAHEPDWAFADRIVPSRLQALRPRAAELLAERAAEGVAWGFKDPRTAVLLDFYDDLAPDARHVFVYRSPWDVLASLLRTRDGELHGRAGLAVAAWTTYNARLLSFRERRPGRTVLVHVDAVAGRPADVIELAQAQLDAIAPQTTLDADRARGAFVEGILLRSDARSTLAELLAADHPGAIELYGRLEADADLPGVAPRRSERPPAVAVEAAAGTLAVSAVLLVAGAGGVQEAEMLARPAVGGAPALAVDAAIDRLPCDLIAVVFDGQPAQGALAAAVTALHADRRLGAILLAGPDGAEAPHEYDPLDCVDAGAAIVLRRDAWMSERGFTVVDPPEGFEAWAFAVGCSARGIRVARFAGLDRTPHVTRDAEHAASRVLERHPALAARRALQADERVRAAQLLAADAEQRAADARVRAADADVRATGGEQRLLEAQAERERATEQLAALRGTRAWRLLARWWRVRARVRRRPRRG